MNEIIPPMIAAWFLGIILMALGTISHYRIKNTPVNTGLGFTRYIGLLGGAAVVVGIPVTEAATPYIAHLSTEGNILLFTVIILMSITASHVGWKHLGPEAINTTN